LLARRSSRGWFRGRAGEVLPPAEDLESVLVSVKSMLLLSILLAPLSYREALRW
jgi:hypothetical protein